ncbi:HAD family acid phosphatase [Nocardioides sp. DS6]|uniref:HAD family acid phosphatase n=1 Tax=Nocardioides eburneus TaxID=3231482 RepID=A0ABV3SW84_9ACTN
MNRSGIIAATAAALLTGGLLAGTSPAEARQSDTAHHRTPAPPAHRQPAHQSRLAPKTHFTMVVDQATGAVASPTSGEDIPNIDSVKSTIRTYYGAYKGPDPTGQASGQIYLPNLTTSPYAANVRRIERRILQALPVRHRAHQAVVFDVDATLLLDYAFEEATNFNYDPTVNNTWVMDEAFPAVPGMPRLLRTIKARGYDLYGITGRPFTQEDATVANLTAQGFTRDGTASGTPLFDDDNLYTKWNTADPSAKPAYIGDCTLSLTCNTVEYKANTRKHIEQDLGDTVVMNVGDQWSDLEGGYAARDTKIPNPTYFLAAADIAGAPRSDRRMVPPTEYTMAPDGSSGARVRSGDDIPNLDPLRKEIRAYENAPTGIADKTSSPYISQMARLVRQWQPRLVSECQRLAARGQRPAIVFDADDTTLWTYDMEDGAMKFSYDPALQDQWVQDERFPATPSMVGLETAIAAAGCTPIGLTGRNDAQKDATLGNLAKVGYVGFTPATYYTKWASGGTPPAYIDCGTDDTCSTIEYKSQTRRHVVAQGYRIVANFGDQYSDLIGGYAEHAVKLPNPTYYLP